MNVVRVDGIMCGSPSRPRSRMGCLALLVGAAAAACPCGAALAQGGGAEVQELHPTIVVTSESTLPGPGEKAPPRAQGRSSGTASTASATATAVSPSKAAVDALTGGPGARAPRSVKTLPGMKYGGHSKDVTEFNGVGVTRKTGTRYALHFPGETKLNSKLIGIFKDSEERFNACYLGAIDAGQPAEALTSANFDFAVSAGTMRVSRLSLAPGSNVGKPLAACLGRVMRKLMLPVSKDVAGTFRIEFAHRYESRTLASAR